MDQKKERSTMDAARLLVVDDDLAVLQALPQMLQLRLRNVLVETAASVQSAIASAQAHQYDAILSDIKMPGLDGFDLLAALQRIQPETPVLLITGHGDQNLAIRALRSGAYDYILKPIDRDDCIAAVQRALDTTSLRRQVQHQQQTLEQYATSLEQQVSQRTEELQQANTTLAAVNDAKEQMLRVVVHEMAGPLTSIKGMVQLLHRQVRREPSGEQFSQSFEITESAIHRLERLLQDLHDTTQIQTGQFQIQGEPTDLVSLCQRTIDEFACESVPCCSHDGAIPAVMANVDPHRLSQALLNLLSNARKYASKDAPITVTLQYNTQEIRIAVHDQGIGIAADALQRIFEPFYRVPSGAGQRTAVKGLGLGLAIARAVLEAHHGRLEVQSQSGQGSTFAMLLPTSGTTRATTTIEARAIVWTLAR